MCSILACNAKKFVGFWGSAPDPAGGAYDAPPDPLVDLGLSPPMSETDLRLCVQV